mmetsp:Transcript_12871/g.41073  ORF Transcript_12871/g.41073 Transcript_12871/m.41073 type:complete len:211 (-) Transcript_12871:6-638(-)
MHPLYSCRSSSHSALNALPHTEKSKLAQNKEEHPTAVNALPHRRPPAPMSASSQRVGRRRDGEHNDAAKVAPPKPVRRAPAALHDPAARQPDPRPLGLGGHTHAAAADRRRGGGPFRVRGDEGCPLLLRGGAGPSLARPRAAGQAGGRRQGDDFARDDRAARADARGAAAGGAQPGAIIRGSLSAWRALRVVVVGDVMRFSTLTGGGCAF